MFLIRNAVQTVHTHCTVLYALNQNQALMIVENSNMYEVYKHRGGDIY